MESNLEDLITRLTNTRELLKKLKKKPLLQIIYLNNILNKFLHHLMEKENFLKQWPVMEEKILLLSDPNITKIYAKPTVQISTSEFIKELEGSYDIFKNINTLFKRLITDIQNFVNQSRIYMRELSVVELNIHSNNLINDFLVYCNTSRPKIDGFLLFIKNIISRLKDTTHPLVDKEQMENFRNINAEIIGDLMNYGAWEKRVLSLRNNFLQKNSIISREYQLLQQLQDNRAVILEKMLPVSAVHHNLRNGDIIVGYKMYGFFKLNLLSKAIAQITKSAATHIMMYYNGKILEASLGHNAVQLSDLHDKHHEILLVFRPKLSSQQLALLNTVIPNYLGHNDVDPKFKYSYKKLIGFYFKRKHDFFSRFFKNNNAFFCSELIDMIFKDIGIRLSIKSDSSQVSPKDIIESDIMNFMFIIDGTSGQDSVDEITEIVGQMKQLIDNDLVTLQY